jgi:predicted permease
VKENAIFTKKRQTRYVLNITLPLFFFLLIDKNIFTKRRDLIFHLVLLLLLAVSVWRNAYKHKGQEDG